MHFALTQQFCTERSEAITGPISSGTTARPSAVISAGRLLSSGSSRRLKDRFRVCVYTNAYVIWFAVLIDRETMVRLLGQFAVSPSTEIRN
jgi:hypothetical protein